MNKKVIMLVSSVVVVLIVLMTTSYALIFNKDRLANNENYTTGNLSIILENDEEGFGNTLTLNNAVPVSDSVGSSSTPYRFKITNNGNLDYVFDLTLTKSGTINGSYVKVKMDDQEAVTLTNATTTLATGLKLYAGESMIVNIRVWIDENIPNSEIGKTMSATIATNGQGTLLPVPNAPKLVDGLIPVMYDTTNSIWVKADTVDKNGTYKWYDYDNKQWANAVLVSSTNRETYVNAAAGTAIPEADVLVYYVWIPRYKYKVWNINKIGQAESNYGYNAYTEGIDIVFESGTASTGTIDCTTTPYSFAAPTESARNETCSGANNDYYTHPAFWWDKDGDSVHDEGEELEGFWMGKFELSSETPTATNGGGNSTSLTVRSKPNTISWRGNTVTNFYKVIYDMQIENNIYGLSTDRTNTDSHMIKNMEWGAVAYLTNSKYGRCSNNVCTEVAINGNANVYSAGNAYRVNINQTTTGNIYGVYDMSGGANEYVMGNMSSGAGSYTYYTNGGGSNFTYSAATARYVDTYANGTTNVDQTSFNRSRLGDATGEVVLKSGSNYIAWYGDLTESVRDTNSWFLRGGNYSNGTSSGIFYFGRSNGTGNANRGARAILLGF